MTGACLFTRYKTPTGEEKVARYELYRGSDMRIYANADGMMIPASAIQNAEREEEDADGED